MLQSVLDNILPSADFYEKTGLLWKIVIIIVAIKVFGEISKRIGQPSVFGKLLAGIILGPSILGIIPNTGPLWHSIKELSDIGIILLMFIAGLETDVDEFKKTAKGSFWVAFLGVLVPLGAGYLLTAVYGYKWTAALFVGVVLVATSVSISVQTLRELRHLQTREGITILGAAVIDDVLGLIILSLVIGIEAGTGNSAGILFWVILKVALFTAIAVLAAKFLVKPLLNKVSKFGVTMPELSLALVIAFLYAMGAELFGLAGIIGAYMAGIILTSTPFKNKILGEIEPLAYSFFVPIFFVSIGVTADMRGMNTNILIFTVILTLLAVFSKIIGCGAGALVSKFSMRSSFKIGAGMVARGEVALIVAAYGLDHRIIDNELYTAVIVVAIITTLVTPPLLKFAYKEKEQAYDKRI